MALAPEITVVGDLVTVLLGGSVPFVVREWESESKDKIQTYQLVGDCYVHGCMDGELVQDAKSETLETLVLR
jgi:hypothetical protein